MAAADAAVASAASCQRTAVLRGTVTRCDEHLNIVTCDVTCSTSQHTHTSLTCYCLGLHRYINVNDFIGSLLIL